MIAHRVGTNFASFIAFMVSHILVSIFVFYTQMNAEIFNICISIELKDKISIELNTIVRLIKLHFATTQ